VRIDDGVKEVLEIAMEQLLQENQNALLGLAGNFPLPVIGPLMGALCFPFGKAYHGPDDRMRQTVARVITNPSAFRSIMEEGIFISRDPNNRLRQVRASLVTPAQRLAAAFVTPSSVPRTHETCIDRSSRRSRWPWRRTRPWPRYVPDPACSRAPFFP